MTSAMMKSPLMWHVSVMMTQMMTMTMQGRMAVWVSGLHRD
jgi:hypothetical protein